MTQSLFNCSWSGLLFDLGRKDFVRMLAKDVEEAEELRMEKVKEAEKSALSGKKSRRQRKMLKEQRLEGRGRVSYPSFAARRESRSRLFMLVNNSVIMWFRIRIFLVSWIRIR